MKLDRRTLNRTTLHRQQLLQRTDRTVTGLLEHLVGMQGQNPHDPYYGMWARLEAFDPDELGDMVVAGSVVRGQLMRGTIHMLTARDFAHLRPLFDALCARILDSTQYGKDTKGIDRDRVLALSVDHMAEKPRSRAELGRHLSVVFPDVPPGSLAQVATYLLPVVQTPPRGLWGQSGAALWRVAEPEHLEHPDKEEAEEDLVIRYLQSFGPATVADVRTWSGLPGVRVVVDRLADRLVVHFDERGSELLDVFDGVVVDAATPAPPRLLPEYDNVLLGHADRSRFFADDGPMPPGWAGNLLVDGVYAGHWKAGKDHLGVTLARAVTTRQRREVTEEAERLVERAWGDGTRHPMHVSLTG